MCICFLYREWKDLSHSLTTLAKEFHTILPTATSVCKATATKGGEFEASDKESLAHTMSHSVSRAGRYCRAYGESKNVQGYDVIGSILQVTTPTGKKRQRFSQQQTQIIEDHFSERLSAKEIPSPGEIERFLVEYREKFPGRKRGNIYSKIRNLIGRKK